MTLAISWFFMAAPTPLSGPELIDCARANAKFGTATASERCGYGQELEVFRQELIQACQNIGVEIHELSDLMLDPRSNRPQEGIEVAPDSLTEL